MLMIGIVMMSIPFLFDIHFYILYHSSTQISKKYLLSLSPTYLHSSKKQYLASILRR